MAFFDKKEPLLPGVAECEKKLGELEKRKTVLIMQIGQMFLEKNSLEDVAGTPYEEMMKEIQVIEKEKEFQNKRMLAVQGKRKCEKCGNVLVLESVFCNKCGEKLEPLFAEEMAKQNICPQCGATHSEEAAFCTSCGYKLK